MIDKFDQMIFFEYVSGDDIDVYSEGKNVDSLESYLAFKKEFKPYLKKMKKAMKEKDFTKAKKYHKECQSLLANMKKEMEELDENSNVGTMMLGQILHSLIVTAECYGVYSVSVAASLGLGITTGAGLTAAALASVTVAALPLYLFAIFKSLQIIFRILDSIDSEKDGLKSRNFNTMRASILRKIKKLEKALKENEKIIKAAEKGFDD